MARWRRAARSCGRKRSTRTWFVPLPSSAEKPQSAEPAGSDLDPLEQHLLTALGALVPGVSGSPAPHADAVWRAQVGSRCCRLRGALAAEAAPLLLLDRLGRAREQCRRRAGTAAERPGPAPLPLGCLLSGAGRSGRTRRDPGRDAGRRRRVGRADRGRPPQGVRPPRAGHHPADVDDRLAPPARGRRRVRDRPRPQARRPEHLAGRRDRGHELRRRVGEPRHRTGGDQHRLARRPPAPAVAAAARLRGQRHRDQRPLAAGWVESTLSSRPAIRYEAAAGDDPESALAVARELADWVRETRRPAVLHLHAVRYLGHAGADVETRLQDSGGHPRGPAAGPLARDRRVARPNGHAHGRTAPGGVPRRARARAEGRPSTPPAGRSSRRPPR